MSMASFGVPVVPLVPINQATSSSRPGSTSTLIASKNREALAVEVDEHLDAGRARGVEIEPLQEGGLADEDARRPAPQGAEPLVGMQPLVQRDEQPTARGTA